MCAGLYFYQPLSDKQHCQKVKVMLGIVWSLPHNQKTHRGLWTPVNSVLDEPELAPIKGLKGSSGSSPGNDAWCQRATVGSLK